MNEIVDDLIPGLLDGCDPDHFWKILAETCAERIGMCVTKPLTGQVMTDAEAIKFEKTEMPFGKHRGEPIGSIDPEYLAAVVESDFNQQLRRYFRSARFRRFHHLPSE